TITQYVISAKAEIQALARSREPLHAITSAVKQKRRTSGRFLTSFGMTGCGVGVMPPPCHPDPAKQDRDLYETQPSEMSVGGRTARGSIELFVSSCAPNDPFRRRRIRRGGDR